MSDVDGVRGFRTAVPLVDDDDEEEDDDEVGKKSDVRVYCDEDHWTPLEDIPILGFHNPEDSPETVYFSEFNEMWVVGLGRHIRAEMAVVDSEYKSDTQPDDRQILDVSTNPASSIVRSCSDLQSDHANLYRQECERRLSAHLA